MHRINCTSLLIVYFVGVVVSALAQPATTRSIPKTTVTIEGDKFLLNGRPTYEGRTWKGKKIEGLMMNSRMVQGIFDDLNPATVSRWAYADTGRWDAERNTREFLAAMPAWRAHTACSPSASTSRAARPRATRGTSRGAIPPSTPTARCAPTTWRA